MNIGHPPHTRSRWLRLLATPSLILLAVFSRHAGATAAMDSCNESSYECRARIASIYIDGAIAFVFLEGNLKPSMCTAAAYTYAWTLDLTAAGANARLSMLLAAYARDDAVELRTYASACALTGAKLGT